MIYIIVFAAIMGTLGQLVDKHLVNLGISRKEYFYLMCLSMIPYSIVMLLIEFKTNNFYFDFQIPLVILIVLAMVFRYVKQHTVVGCLSHLNPYEDSAYLSLGIVLAYIIDVIIGSENLFIFNALSVIGIVIGVFLVSNSKLEIGQLKKDLIIRICTSLIISYITFFILKYITNASYLFIVNLALVILFTKTLLPPIVKRNKSDRNKIIKWVFIQQFCGFGTLYLSNILINYSVTLSSYVRPLTILLLVIFPYITNKKIKPTLKQLLGVILIIISIIIINN